MTTTTDNDLKELKDLINSRFDKVFDELVNIKVDIATLKEGQNSLNTRIDETNKRIDETNKRIDETKEAINKRMDESKEAINKRLDNLDFIARSVVTCILVALLAGLTKMLYPNLFG